MNKKLKQERNLLVQDYFCGKKKIKLTPEELNLYAGNKKKQKEDNKYWDGKIWFEKVPVEELTEEEIDKALVVQSIKESKEIKKLLKNIRNVVLFFTGVLILSGIGWLLFLIVQLSSSSSY